MCPGKSTATFVACTDTTNTSVDAFVVNPEVLDLQFQVLVMTDSGLSARPDVLDIQVGPYAYCTGAHMLCHLRHAEMAPVHSTSSATQGHSEVLATSFRPPFLD